MDIDFATLFFDLTIIVPVLWFAWEEVSYRRRQKRHAAEMEARIAHYRAKWEREEVDAADVIGLPGALENINPDLAAALATHGAR